MNSILNLNYIKNEGCKRGCSKSERSLITENDLCTDANSVYHNLPIRCVGKWAEEKIYHLVQYFGIFSNGMKNKWNGELNYIEICSGPGRCVSRDDGMEFDGTALSILKHKAFRHIKKALFFDFNNIVIETLNKRIENLGIKNAKVLFGDYSQPEKLRDEIRNIVNPKSLNLVFIDPTDCSVPFSLISNIKQVIPKTDFIINLATGTDFNRNVINALLKKESYQNTVEKYSGFIGSSDFFNDSKNIKFAKEGNNTGLRNSFRKYYKNNLMSLGYKYFDIKRIKHYYDLLFASQDPQGLSFWEKANKIKFNDQTEIPFSH